MSGVINVFQPQVGMEELKAVEKVFSSNWLGKGKITDQFEGQFAHHLGVDRPHIKSTTCCTEALFQSITTLSIGEGDEVILPTISFVGAGNAIANAGAIPVFCDVDLRTLNPDVENIESKITPRTRAILLLHYGGVPCKMDEILALAYKYNIYVIEDSACSVASKYKGRACGILGDVGMWSFDAMKILVTADGGMIYFKSKDLIDKFAESTYLGLAQNSGFASKAGGKDKWWKFEISCFGHRAIMNDLTASIGLEQLKKLPDFITKRKQVHEFYTSKLNNISWLQVPPAIPQDVESSYYFYWIQMKDAETRDALAEYLWSKGIYTTFRYYPLHLVEKYGAQTSLPNAEKAAQTTLCIPIHQSLSDDDLNRVVNGIIEFGAKL